MNGILFEKLAPHMIVGLEGSRLTDEERSLLSRHPLAGVILFERNVRDARSLMELTREIREIFHETKSRVPLIAVDHEGGIVSYLALAIGAPPTQMAAARAGDPHLVERLFEENARRMRACGVNMLLGPVADVNTEERNPVIGTRSFGDDAAAVSSLVSTAVGAARRGGVLTCLKHFPGHGASSVDSHLALPILDSTLEELRRKDVLPFRSGLEAGADSVMMGHIAPRGRALPASLDPGIIGALLRGELGFDGAVMTDGLEMEGVKGDRSFLDICERSLAAGNDILLFSKPACEVFESFRAAETAATGGAFWGERFGGISKLSAPRVERLIAAAGAREREFEIPSDPSVYGEIAERSMAVQGMTGGGQPPRALPRGGRIRVVFYCDRGALERCTVRSFIVRILNGLRFGRSASAGEGTRLTESLGSFLDDSGLASLAGAAAAVSGLEVFGCETKDGRGEPRDIVFLMNRGPIEESAARNVCAGASAVVVAGWPYAARFLPSAPALFITYGIYDAAADTLCRRLS